MLRRGLDVTIHVLWFFSPFVRGIVLSGGQHSARADLHRLGRDLCGCRCGILRRAPAVSLAVSGSVLGAVGGFLIGNADGPAEVPAYIAVGASVGLFANGVLGMLATIARPPSEPLRRAAWVMLVAGPLVAAVLAMLLQVACPLYVTGRRTGFCNYQEVDQLGGWVSGVIVAFMLDTWFVVGLLLLSARQARRFGGRHGPEVAVTGLVLALGASHVARIMWTGTPRRGATRA